MLNQSVQCRFGDGETISKLQSDPIDGFDQIVVVDRPPLVARKRMASCCRKRPLNRLRDWICSCRCRGGRRKTDLLRLEELSDSISVDDPRDGSDHEDLAGLREDEEPAEKDILFDKETALTPLPGAPTVDRISSTVLRGVSHEGRSIDRGARDQDQEGNRDTRVIQV